MRKWYLEARGISVHREHGFVSVVEPSLMRGRCNDSVKYNATVMIGIELRFRPVM